MRMKAGSRIVVEEEAEVGVCEEFDDEATDCFRTYTCCLIVLGMAMGVDVSHHDVVIPEVKNKVKVWCEIRGTAGDREM